MGMLTDTRLLLLLNADCPMDVTFKVRPLYSTSEGIEIFPSYLTSPSVISHVRSVVERMLKYIPLYSKSWAEAVSIDSNMAVNVTIF